MHQILQVAETRKREKNDPDCFIWRHNVSISGDDKELLKSSGLAIVDAVAAGVDTILGGTSLATGAWGLSKALFGRGLALRQKKALEWVEMVRDNPLIYTRQLLETEEFQDSFVTSLEGYIKERDGDKRSVLRAIFLDYSTFPEPTSYPLERLNEITKQLTIFDAKNFSYLVHLASEQNPDVPFQDTRHSLDHIESAFRLISLGLLAQDTSARWGDGSTGVKTPFVFVSGLGIRYYEFVKSSGISHEEETK
jgi:hypothetical protein